MELFKDYILALKAADRGDYGPLFSFAGIRCLVPECDGINNISIPRQPQLSLNSVA